MFVLIYFFNRWYDEDKVRGKGLYFSVPNNPNCIIEL